MITLAVFRQAIGCRSVFKREQRASCFSLNYALFFVFCMAFRLKLFSKGCAFACIGRTLSGIQEVRGSIPLISTREKYLQKSGYFFFVCFLQKGERGIEGAAAQSDSPVDCRDRGRPRRAVRAARRPPLPAPEKKHCRSSAFFSLQFRCSEAVSSLAAPRQS